MKLRSGRIVGFYLNVRVLRSGREIPTLPAKPAPKNKDVVNRVRFTTETRFNQKLDNSSPLIMRGRKKGAYNKLLKNFKKKTVLEYIKYLDG